MSRAILSPKAGEHALKSPRKQLFPSSTVIPVAAVLTAEQFVETRFELADAGRWSELVAGEVLHLHPPDEAHGTTILNLSKSLGSHLQAGQEGALCFELGIVVVRDRDTLRFPAASFFRDAGRFAFADVELTETAPDLVVEVASTSDRRAGMADRVHEYHSHGIRNVWVLDCIDECVHVLQRDALAQQLDPRETLRGGAAIPGFEMAVAELFAPPEWWS